MADRSTVRDSTRPSCGQAARSFRAARVVLAVGLFLNAAGCQQKENASDPPQNDTGSTQAPNDEAAARAEAMQDLAALGYVDYSPEKADPDLMGVVRHDPERSHPGYNLYCNPSLASAFLIDETGKVIQSWSHEQSDHWSNPELLPNGDLLVPGSNPKRYLLRLSWDGRLIWKRKVSSHHDVEVTPRDQILTLTSEFVQRPIDPLLIRDTPLVLLAHNGRVIEQVSLYDVLTTRPDLLKLNLAGIKKVRAGGKTAIDLLHSNSIEWMHHKHLESRDAIYAAGNVIISMRYQNAVVIIDWQARQLLWAWGPGEVLGPHDATVLESGNILLFDNGRRREWSRVVELNPLTREIVWEYKAPTPTDFYTPARGSSQRLGNGNTLITNSKSGQVFEVTPEGEVVWEFLSPQLNDEGHRAAIVRMKRYERAFVDRILKKHPAADGPRVP